MTQMINKTYMVMLAVFLFGGCAYYGTDTFLVQSSEDKYVMCSGIKIRVDGMLSAQNNKVFAFAGIPLFPSVTTSHHIGELHVWYENIPDGDICTTTDLYLKDMITESIHLPNDIWKSKIVEKDGVKYMGCIYKFGQQLDYRHEYSVYFSDNKFDCEIPVIQLTIKQDSGYHPIPLQ